MTIQVSSKSEIANILNISNLTFKFVGIKIPKYVTSWVAQRQLPDFVEKLYEATLRYTEIKSSMKWGKNRDPGFEYPSDVRLDDFEGNEEDEMEDNVNKMRKLEIASEHLEEEEKEVEEPSKSWWSYFLPYNYKILH